MSKDKEEIIKKIAAHTWGRNASQVLGFFIAVFMRNFLGPLYMGMWSLMRIVLSHAVYSELGALQAIYYKVPYYNGRGEKHEVRTVQGVVFSFLILSGIAVSCLVVILSFLFKSKIPQELFVGFLIFPAFFLAQRIYFFYVMLLRAHKKFVLLGKTYFFDSAFNLILVLLLVSRFKLYGLYVASVLLPILDICYILLHTRFRFRFGLVWKKVKEYISFGFPVFISALSLVMFYSIDRLMIAKFLGLVPLGYYSIAILTRTYSTEISQNFASVLSPYFIESYGKTGDISHTGKKVVKYTEAIAGIMAVVLGAMYIAFPVFVHYAMPRYEPGISAMKVMLVCTFFMVVSGHLRNLLVMKERQVFLMKLTFLAIVINAVVNYSVLRAGMGITAVAAASSFTAFVLFAGIFFFAIAYVKDIKPHRTFIRILAPFAYSIAVVFILEMVVPAKSILLTASIKLVSFALAALVIIFHVNRQTHVFAIVSGMIKDRFKKER